MAEVRVKSMIILMVVVGVIGFLVLSFGGFFSVWIFNKNTFDNALEATKGYTAAKTPAEAMAHFHKAIQNRQYRTAAKYCTKGYADLLTRSHTNANELGTDIDKIDEFGKNKAILTDKMVFLLNWLDPFPKNFKVGDAPKQDPKDANKAVGMFIVEPLSYKNQGSKVDLSEWKDLDLLMYQKALVGPLFAGPVRLVKEGEEWKLDVPTNPAWELAVKVFNDRSKTYHTGLTGLISDQTREKYETPRAYEHDIVTKLRAAKD